MYQVKHHTFVITYISRKNIGIVCEIEIQQLAMMCRQILVLLTFILLIGIYDATNFTALGMTSSKHRSIARFGLMINKTLDVNPLIFNGYGC